MIIGSSRPSCWRQAATDAASTWAPPEPSRITQTSPGMRRISTKTSAAAPASVGIASRSLVAMERYMGFAPPPRGLLVEPDVGQVLVQVVARADLPALHVGPRQDDAVPVGQHDLVHHGIERVLLVGAHGDTLLGRIGLDLHRLV